MISVSLDSVLFFSVSLKSVLLYLLLFGFDSRKSALSISESLEFRFSKVLTFDFRKSGV